MHRRTFLRHSSVALAASAFTACSSKAKPQLHVFTWSDYLDPTLQQKFENLHKCTVVIDTYDSNEAMFAKLKGGATGYDIVVPSSYMVKAMIRENLLAKLDLTKIPNTKNIDADHLKIALDPENAAQNMEFIGYRAPNSAAYPLLSEDFRGNPVLFPEDELYAKCAPIDDIGESIAIWTAAWDQIKSA